MLRQDFGAAGVTIQDDDPLIRFAAVRAAACLEPLAAASACTFRYVGVHGLQRVASCPLDLGRADRRGVLRERRSPLSSSAPPGGQLTVLYTLRDHVAARLHALHGCADCYAVLTLDRPERCSVDDLPPCRFEMLNGTHRLLSAGLTPREAAVLALVLARLSDDEIARQLVISRSTVRTHFRSILRKLALGNRQELRSALLPPSGLEPPWLRGR